MKKAVIAVAAICVFGSMTAFAAVSYTHLIILLIHQTHKCK